MPELLLPPGIRYECIRCGLCCRSLEVRLTEEEYQRLTARDWSAELPDSSPQRLFARIRRPRGKHVWRLRPYPSGACRFLTDDGLCRVHSTLGFDAKPFAGRLFPFTFLQTPVGVFVGVRFNCPAVVRAVGPALQTQRGELKRLYDDYAFTYQPATAGERVRFFGRYQLEWADVLRVEDQLLAFLRLRELDVAARLLACRRLVRRFVGGALRRRADGQVGADPQAIVGALRQGVYDIQRLSLAERMMMRLLVAMFLGASLPSFRERSALGRARVRLGNLAQRYRMAVRLGRVRLPEVDARVRIRAVESLDLTAVDAASSEMLERYFMAKVASQGFFGLSFFGRSFAEGLDFLVSAYGVIVWLAGAHAIAAGRRELTAEHIEYGIRQVDYGFNYLGAFGSVPDRVRTLLFWQRGTPEKLLAVLSKGRRDHR